MKMSGEYCLPGDPASVWEALDDPAVLKEAIPGAESVEAQGGGVFRAVVRAKIGPISARFSGLVARREEDYPRGFTLSGEGQGGAAGFAKGAARITLAAEEGGRTTRLSYEVEASVGGKLAQIGQRLIDAAAAKLARQFFENFARLMGAGAGPEAAPASEAATAPEAGAGFALWKYGVIVGFAAAMAAVLFFLFG